MPRPHRVLLTADAVGGVWQYATDLARGLTGHGVETVLAVLGPALSADQRDEAGALPSTTLVETGLPLDWLAKDTDEVAAAGVALAEIAEEHAVDLVHLNQPALAARTRFGVPVLTMSHSCLSTWWAATEGGALPADFRWRAALHGEGLRRADRVLCPSHAFAEATWAAYDLPDLPAVILNGRAPALPSAPREDFAFTAGRLWDRGKDVATLDRAASRSAHPFRAAGGVRAPHGEVAAFSHLQLLGHIDEARLFATLAARPVFVSAARYEPFGLAVLEAAAAGCALVLADIPTFRELWDGAATFVPAGDDAAFAGAVDRLIADPAARDSQGQKARVTAARYTPERTAAATAMLYDELASAPTVERAAA